LRIALAARNEEKKRPATQVARKAYDTIQRLRKTAELTHAQHDKLDRKLFRLKDELRTLGEVF